MIEPKTILLTFGDDSAAREVGSYVEADVVMRNCAAALKTGERVYIRSVVVFTDLFVWRSSLSVDRDDAKRMHFVQHALRADWEFNAGVRPAWWPSGHEADRMWGVHYREDRDNGRAELARMRLERYDLQPVALTALPPRTAAAP